MPHDAPIRDRTAGASCLRGHVRGRPEAL